MTELATVENSGDMSNPFALIDRAVEKGVSVDVMERLCVLRREWQAEQAENEYNAAMTALQAEMPVIKKTKGIPNKEGVIKYYYAPLESIIPQVADKIAGRGFRYDFDQELIEGQLFIVCIVTHKAGHSVKRRYKLVDFSVPGGNAAQNASAGNTMAKRGAFCNAFGILTSDSDNAGEGTDPVETITESQAANLSALLDELPEAKRKEAVASLLKFAGVGSIEQIPATKFAQCVKGVEARRGRA